MATNFPASKDDGTSLPNPGGTDKQNSPDHGALHTTENAAIIAVENKLGTGASTPVVSTLLFGTGTGTSAWTQLTSAQLAASLSDETGSGSVVFATTPTLVTPKVDTINEATGGNGTSVNGVLLKSSKVNGSFITDSSLASAQLGTGMVVQVVDALFSAVATGTTVLPYDDTIPQNTEGDQYMTLAITPKATTNKLIIESTAHLANSATSQRITAALFQDSTAGALAAGDTVPDVATAGIIVPVLVYHSMAAGTVSSTTFKIRAGANGAGTTTFNGDGAARKFGGITLSYIKITEIKV